MKSCVAWYARVSSEQQSQADTIASQIAALKQRIQVDGLTVPDDFGFIDEGYSGATLVRPDLERLRDTVAAGLIDRLYVHAPDRLSRKYAYQVLLLEEFQRAGVEVAFLNQQPGESAEEQLLLQVQGIILDEFKQLNLLWRQFEILLLAEMLVLLYHVLSLSKRVPSQNYARFGGFSYNIFYIFGNSLGLFC